MADVKNQIQLAIAAARAGRISEARILAKRVLDQDPENVNALLLMGTLSDSDTEQASYLNQILVVDPDHEIAKERLHQLNVPAKDEQIIDEELSLEELMGAPFDEVPETVVGETSLVQDKDFEDLFASELDESWLEESDEEPVTEINQMLQDVPPPTVVQPVADETRLTFEEQAKGETIPEWLIDEGDFIDRSAKSQEEPTAVFQPADEEEIPDWLFAESDEEWPEMGLDEQEATEEAVSAQAQPAEIPGPVGGAKPKPRVSTRGLEVLLVLLIILALVIVVALVLLISNPL